VSVLVLGLLHLLPQSLLEVLPLVNELESLEELGLYQELGHLDEQAGRLKAKLGQN